MKAAPVPPASPDRDQIPPRLPSVAMDRLEHLVLAAADQQLHCVIRFAGHVDASRLARAVRLTLDAEPVLGCRFVERPWRPFWARLPGLDARDHCPIETPADPDAALAHYIVMALDLAAGPQAQARLFRGADDLLCVKLNHAVADGGGVIEYAGLLAATYRALGADAGHVPHSNLAGARGLGQVFRRIRLPALLAALRRSTIPTPAWGFPAQGKDLSGRSLLIRRVAADRVKAARAYAHNRGVSFSDVLLTAFYRALFEVLDPPVSVPLPVQEPVNLRRYLPGGRAAGISNLAGSIYPTITREPGATFEAALAQVHAARTAASAGLPGLGQALTLEAALALPYVLAQRLAVSAMSGAQTGKTHPFFSNMGVLDPAEVDFGDVPVTDAYGVGPVLYPPGFFLALSTFQGMLTLATSFCHTAVDARRVAQCLDHLVAELPS